LSGFLESVASERRRCRRRIF